MHIPDNYLSPATCAVMTAVMVPVWVHSIHKIKQELPKEKLPMMGVGAAFSFLGMMFNVPLPGGTSGHAVGGTLIALLLGPEAACLSVSIALLLQALLFGDGGILAFGANCFNMAFLLPYAGWGIAKLLQGKKNGHPVSGRRAVFAAGVGAYVGINLAAFAAAVEFGIQPLLFHDAAGMPLYCPYPLAVSVPAMMLGHLTVAGAAEVIFTIGVLAYIGKTAPALLEQNNRAADKRPVFVFLAALIALVPLGLLTAGTAWGEWGSDEIAQVVSGGQTLGYTPAGMVSGLRFEAIFPDYAIQGMPVWLGYILSAVIGVALLIIIFKLIGSISGKKDVFTDAVS